MRIGYKAVFAILVSVLIGLSACKKDENYPALEILQKDLVMKVDQVAKVEIKGGSGNFAVSSSDPSVLDVSIKSEGVIEVKSKASGKVDVKILDKKTSENKSFSVQVFKDLTIDKNDIKLEFTSTEEVLILSGSGKYSLEKSSEGIVAKLSEKDGNIIISAEQPGNYELTLKDEETKDVVVIKVEIVVEKMSIAGLTLNENNSYSLIVLANEPMELNIHGGSGKFQINNTSKSFNVRLNNDDGFQLVVSGGNPGDGFYDYKEGEFSIMDEITEEVLTFDVVVAKPLSIGTKMMHLVEGGESYNTGIVEGSYDFLTLNSSKPDVAIAEKAVSIFGTPEIKVISKNPGEATISAKIGNSIQEIVVNVSKAQDISIPFEEVFDGSSYDGYSFFIDADFQNSIFISPNINELQDFAIASLPLYGSRQYEVEFSNENVVYCDLEYVPEKMDERYFKTMLNIFALDGGETNIKVKDKVTGKSLSFTVIAPNEENEEEYGPLPEVSVVPLLLGSVLVLPDDEDPQKAYIEGAKNDSFLIYYRGEEKAGSICEIMTGVKGKDLEILKIREGLFRVNLMESGEFSIKFSKADEVEFIYSISVREKM